MMLAGCQAPSRPARAVPEAARAFRIRPGLLVLEPVEPISGARAGLLDDEPGYLRVYSATEARDVGGVTYHPHTPYLVYTAEGKRVKSVLNRAGSMDQTPMTGRWPRAGRSFMPRLTDSGGWRCRC